MKDYTYDFKCAKGYLWAHFLIIYSWVYLIWALNVFSDALNVFYDTGVWWLPLSLWCSLIFLNLYKSMNLISQLNWHIQWNEHQALELSYDLGLGCSPLFSNSTDYDSSYPWIRLTFVHLMGVRPVQTYCWKTNVSISLPSPTSDNTKMCQLSI